MSEKNYNTSVKETVVQNVWQHNFMLPGALSDVGETVAHIQYGNR
jgi:hypothetical protein